MHYHLLAIITCFTIAPLCPAPRPKSKPYEATGKLLFEQYRFHIGHMDRGIKLNTEPKQQRSLFVNISMIFLEEKQEVNIQSISNET